MQSAAPVDQSVLSVDQTLLKQPHKSFLHSCNQVVIHGESQAIPVHADAHAPHLAKDLATVRLHPGEDLFQECIPPCKCTMAISQHQAQQHNSNGALLLHKYRFLISHHVLTVLLLQKPLQLSS